MQALKLKGLSKNFGGLEVLKDISFDLEVGEHAAVIGPNGAGKTTLFNVISGALPTSSGKLEMFGRDITKASTHQRIQYGLGRSFQITRLFPDLTILDNILLALHGTKPSRYHMFRKVVAYDGIMEKAEQLLQQIDLWYLRSKKVKAISYGDQRKMEIIMSLASDPKLILLDEPTAGLAIDEIPSFINTVKALSRSTTVLLTSHDMDVVFGLAERVIVLYYGQFIAEGTPEEIQANPKVREIYLGIEENEGYAES
ncbi:MAG: ABC transporter ATP-binding protein [Syntrophorhabdus sp.]